MIEVGKNRFSVDTTWDGVVIMKYLDGINGGVSLDLTGFEDEYIRAGHVIVKTEQGKFKPAVIADGVYSPLSIGEKAIGVVRATHRPKFEGTAVMTRGKVNEKAYKNWTEVDYSAEIKEALSLIEFSED